MWEMKSIEEEKFVDSELRAIFYLKDTKTYIYGYKRFVINN